MDEEIGGETVRSAWAARRRRPAGIGLGAVVALGSIAVTIGWLGLRAPGGLTPQASAQVSADAAQARAIPVVEAFVGRHLGSCGVSAPVNWPGGAYIEVTEDTGLIAWVDTATGRVVYLLTDVPITTTVKLTPERAQAAAAAYLTAHGIAFDGLTPAVELRDHGASMEYVVTWTRRVNGADVPDERVVELDPEHGQVFSFMDRRVPYAAVPSAVIGRDDAIAKAITASGLESPKVVDVQLKVDSGPAWPGRLVWEVQLDTDVHGYIDAAWIYVDAVTGETKVIGRG